MLAGVTMAALPALAGEVTPERLINAECFRVDKLRLGPDRTAESFDMV
jgi:hypothetical protein